MRDQQLWEEYQLHNFVFKPFIVEDTGSAKFVHQKNSTIVDELAALKEESLEIPILKNSPNKIVVNCLPGNKKDDFYGENRGKITYGDPFTFEGIVVQADDMGLSMWSPTDKVTKGSVIFPQNREKRWWRIIRVEPDTQGWMIHGTISDYQPQFRI